MSEVGDGEGVNLNPSGFIAQAIGQGLGANATLRALREGGGAMGRTPFLRLYGEIRDLVAGRDRVQGLNYDALPDVGAYSTWAAGEGGKFVTFVQAFIRTQGVAEPRSMFFQYHSDRPHTPAEALAFASQQWASIRDTGTDVGDTYLGGVVTSIARTTAYGT